MKIIFFLWSIFIVYINARWWWPPRKRDRCLVTPFFTVDRAPFLHCIIKLGNRKLGFRIPKSMDIVSPIAYLLDFWKNFCCDSTTNGARFANTDNGEVAILENLKPYPLLKSTTSILDEVTLLNPMKLLIPHIPQTLHSF
jgi:hypothetical protein